MILNNTVFLDILEHGGNQIMMSECSTQGVTHLIHFQTGTTKEDFIVHADLSYKYLHFFFFYISGV